MYRGFAEDHAAPFRRSKIRFSSMKKNGPDGDFHHRPGHFRCFLPDESRVILRLSLTTHCALSDRQLVCI
jgi:hypothetical protein